MPLREGVVVEKERLDGSFFRRGQPINPVAGAAGRANDVSAVKCWLWLTPGVFAVVLKKGAN